MLIERNSYGIAFSCRYWVDEEGSVADGGSARCLARCVSRNYVTGCHTATFQWHLISSFYVTIPPHPRHPPARFLLTQGHRWGAVDSVTESAAPHQCPLGDGNKLPLPLYANVRTIRCLVVMTGLLYLQAVRRRCRKHAMVWELRSNVANMGVGAHLAVCPHRLAVQHARGRGRAVLVWRIVRHPGVSNRTRLFNGDREDDL